MHKGTKKLATSIAALAAVAGLAAGSAGAMGDYSGASIAEVDVAVDCDAGVITITSSKDLSNVVFSIDGEHTKLDDFSGYELEIDLEGVETVWVKSGSNASGDGPGYGEAFTISNDCDSGGPGGDL